MSNYIKRFYKINKTKFQTHVSQNVDKAILM